MKVTIPHQKIKAELENIKGYVPHFFTNLIYRIKNIFKAIWGNSDWQITERKIFQLLVQPQMTPYDQTCIKQAVQLIMNDYVIGASSKHSYKTRLTGFSNMSVTFVLER